MRVTLLIICAMFITLPAAGHTVNAKAKCDKVKQKIRSVESRMRQGYTRAQGERLAQQLRDLHAQRAKVCR
jgi:hypothetical protein